MQAIASTEGEGTEADTWGGSAEELGDDGVGTTWRGTRIYSTTFRASSISWILAGDMSAGDGSSRTGR
jgi:hypothetical protein